MSWDKHGLTRKAIDMLGSGYEQAPVSNTAERNLVKGLVKYACGQSTSSELDALMESTPFHDSHTQDVARQTLVILSKEDFLSEDYQGTELNERLKEIQQRVTRTLKE